MPLCSSYRTPCVSAPRSHTTPHIIEHPQARDIRQFCCEVIDVPSCRRTKTAHPEKTRRERHLRSCRTFQRDRLSPSDAGSSVGHCSEHTVAVQNAANRPQRVNPNRARFQNMWVISPRSRAPVGTTRHRPCSPRNWHVAHEVRITSTDGDARYGSYLVICAILSHSEGLWAWTEVQQWRRMILSVEECEPSVSPSRHLFDPHRGCWSSPAGAAAALGDRPASPSRTSQPPKVLRRRPPSDRPNLTAGLHRSDEPHAIEAAVDDHLGALRYH
jgi:hypothetical protein